MMLSTLVSRTMASHRLSIYRHVTLSIEVTQQRRCFTVLLGDNDVSTTPTDQQQVRLSKRMSELGICSRREAAAILKRANEQATNREVSYLKDLNEVIYLRGKPVLDGAAVKVSPDEKYIEIRAGDDPPTVTEGDDELKEFIPYEKRSYEDIMGDTIVLNKPIGYVSGQEEHQHVPAVRLLNRKNIHLNDNIFDKNTQKIFQTNNVFHFDKWKFSGFDSIANSIPKHIRENFEDEKSNDTKIELEETLTGYAPAGRLDVNSTGLVIFTRAGVMARRLIEASSMIPKEYIVTVQPAVQVSVREAEMGLQKLPHPKNDLGILLKEGNNLVGDETKKSLKPLLVAEWLHDEQTTEEDDMNKQHQRQSTRKMRLVLIEGRKRQIRRMCREIIGWHVIDLVRISVGPVKIGDLPQGKWRPLTQHEVHAILKEQPGHSDSDVSSGMPSSAKVKHEILSILEREASRSNHWLTFSKLRKKVGKNLEFLPKDENVQMKWKEYLFQVCKNYPRHFIFRGKNLVGLRKQTGDNSRNANTTMKKLDTVVVNKW